jgi:hypothetical protein
LQRDEPADESDHGVIPLQLDETTGRRLVRGLQIPKVDVDATREITSW